MTTHTKSSKKTPPTKKAAAKKVTKKATKKSTSTTKRATKAATKKIATKATKTTKKTARAKVSKKRPVVEASNEKSFWTTDGQVLNSIIALNDALSEMQEAVYQYHVDKNRHDFADWVELVLDDSDCAAALRRAKTPKTARTVVVRHLKFYQL